MICPFFWSKCIRKLREPDKTTCDDCIIEIKDGGHWNPRPPPQPTNTQKIRIKELQFKTIEAQVALSKTQYELVEYLYNLGYADSMIAKILDAEDKFIVAWRRSNDKPLIPAPKFIRSDEVKKLQNAEKTRMIEQYYEKLGKEKKRFG